MKKKTTKASAAPEKAAPFYSCEEAVEVGRRLLNGEELTRLQIQYYYANSDATPVTPTEKDIEGLMATAYAAGYLLGTRKTAADYASQIGKGADPATEQEEELLLYFRKASETIKQAVLRCLKP